MPRRSPIFNDPDLYEVEEIRGHRYHNGHLQFRVKWKGYTGHDNSWVSEDHFVTQAAAEDLQKYKEKNQDSIEKVMHEGEPEKKRQQRRFYVYTDMPPERHAVHFEEGGKEVKRLLDTELVSTTEALLAELGTGFRVSRSAFKELASQTATPKSSPETIGTTNPRRRRSSDKSSKDGDERLVFGRASVDSGTSALKRKITARRVSREKKRRRGSTGSMPAAKKAYNPHTDLFGISDSDNEPVADHQIVNVDYSYDTIAEEADENQVGAPIIINYNPPLVKPPLVTAGNVVELEKKKADELKSESEIIMRVDCVRRDGKQLLYNVVYADHKQRWVKEDFFANEEDIKILKEFKDAKKDLIDLLVQMM